MFDPAAAAPHTESLAGPAFALSLWTRRNGVSCGGELQNTRLMYDEGGVASRELKKEGDGPVHAC